MGAGDNGFRRSPNHVVVQVAAGTPRQPFEVIKRPLVRGGRMSGAAQPGVKPPRCARVVLPEKKRGRASGCGGRVGIVDRRERVKAAGGGKRRVTAGWLDEKRRHATLVGVCSARTAAPVNSALTVASVPMTETSPIVTDSMSPGMCVMDPRAA